MSRAYRNELLILLFSACLNAQLRFALQGRDGRGEGFGFALCRVRERMRRRMATWSPGDRESPPPAGARIAQQTLVRKQQQAFPDCFVLLFSAPQRVIPDGRYIS